jgi:hypothetical protein
MQRCSRCQNRNRSLATSLAVMMDNRKPKTRCILADPGSLHSEILPFSRRMFILGHNQAHMARKQEMARDYCSSSARMRQRGWEPQGAEAAVGGGWPAPCRRSRRGSPAPLQRSSVLFHRNCFYGQTRLRVPGCRRTVQELCDASLYVPEFPLFPRPLL